jgi:hypothetical protein
LWFKIKKNHSFMKQSLQIFNSMRALFWSVAFLLLLIPVKGFGQVAMTTSGSHTQNFNSLTTSTTASAWSDNSTVANWYSQRTGTGTTIQADAGSTTAGTLYSYGASGNTERAIGSIGSSNAAAGSFSHGVLLRNTSGTTMSNIKVSYTLEQWRNGNNSTPNTITFWYKISTSTISALNPNSNGTWTQVTALSLSSPINTGAAAALDGNLPANRVTATNVTIPSLSLANNSFIMLKWEDPDHTGTDHGLAIDDVTVTWTISSPSTISATGLTNYTYSGLAQGPDTANVTGSTGSVSYLYSGTGTTTYASSATKPINAGTYQVIATVAADSNYDAATSSAYAFTISKAPLTITANNQTVSFGDSVASVLAAATNIPSGFVNGENSSVILGTVSYTTNYTDTTPAGTSGITITPDVSSLTASNYSFTPVNGVITIAASPVPVITSPLTFSADYGTLASTYTIVATNAPTSYSATPLPTGLAFNSSTGEITGTPTALPGNYNITISASNSGGPSTNQILVYTITPKPLTVSGAVADNKIYDRTIVATISGSTLVGIYGSDVVTVSNTGTFSSSLVANGITVTSTQTLSGADAGKYSLTVPTGLTANITPKSLTISGAVAQNKVFDGTTTATITGTLSGVISPDVVTLTLNGAFASSAIGNGIAVTSTSTIGGANSGNYALTQPTGLIANITQPIVPLLQWNTFGNTGNETTQATSSFNVNMTSSSLNYTGSTVAPAGNGNRFGGTWGTVPSLTSNKYIQFTATPAPGYMFTPTSFTFIWDLSGTGPTSVALRSSADNYTSDLGVISGLTSSTTLFRTITISGLTGLSSATTFRLYGYNATGGTGGFDCASSQNNVVLNGYTEVAPPPAISAVNNLAALSTVYGTASATSTFNVSGTFMQAGILVTPPAGYEVSLASGSGFASTITVGAAGTIASTPVYVRLKANATVIASPYSGNIVLSSSNATPVDVATVSSTVTPKTLTVSGLSAINKVYDGNTSATLTGTGSLVGVINSDVVTLDGTPVGTFASADVANGIAVTVTGYSISGAGSGNYSLTQPTLSADITSVPSPLISSALTASATYGVAATTYAIIASESPSSYNATGLPEGLTVNTLTGEITGTPTGLPGVFPVTISATNAGGTGTATLNYTILAKELTITGATANSKVYNKLAATTISGSVLFGIVGTDVVLVSNTANFTSVNVGTAISVTSTQTLSGADANKYSLTLPTGLSADITAKALTISGAVAQNKQFDGTTVATITGTLVTVESGDVVTLNGTGVFASSAIANGIAVTSTSTISGANANNYTLTQPIGLVANITPVTLLQWNTFNNTGNETTEPSVFNNVNVTAANLTQGTITPAANPNRFGGSAWFNTGNTVAGSTLAEAIAGNDYIQFVVTPNSGYTFTATSFSFLWDFSATGPKSVALRSSADGFTTNLGTLTNLTASTSVFRTISISSLVKVSTPTTFRLYGFGGTNTGGTAGFDTGSNQNNVILYGTTALLTGPTASVLSGTTSICDGDSASISVAITDGVGPFTVVYTDGTNNFTETGYTSGANIIVSPSSSPVTYQLVSVTDSNLLAGTGNSGSAVITTLPNVVYYLDSDSDGYGDVNVSFSSCSALPGFVTNATDCDDTNAAIYRSALLYTDVDNDGYNAGSAVTCYGATLPVGTSLSTLGSDCNDNNALVHATFSFYTDADGDGFGSVSATAQLLCAANATTAPVAGVSPYNTDCDDTKSSIRPNAVDVCYDAIDNDCNGNVDNVGLPGGCIPKVANLQSASCGSTVSAFNTIVSASNVPGAQAFRFKITNMTTNVVQILDSPTISFQFMNLPGVTFATQYRVEVAIRFAGVWQGFYGTPCFVNTPSPVSVVSSAQCGGTLTSMSQNINSSFVSNVTGYRYEVTNQTNGQTQYVFSNINRFTLTQLLASNQTFATNYFVRVACRNTDGTYLPEGPGCIVKSPAFPTTQVVSSLCNNYLVPSMVAPVTVDPVPGATLYKFRLFNGTYDFVVESIYNRFTLSMFPGLEQGTLYSVQAAAQVGGIFDTNVLGEQKWGKTCTLTTPNAARQTETAASTPRLEVVVNNEFNALAYPNPFAANFKLNVTTNSEENLTVRVYDMLGKLVEDRQVNTTDVETLEVGANYPSGVYNVIVTQGENTKTLRVIKR